MLKKKQGSDIFLFFRGPQKEAKDYFSSFVPSGLFNILFYLLKNGYNAKLYNLSDLDNKDLTHFLKSHNIKIAFISVFMGNHVASFALAKMIKELHKDAIIVLGGPYTVLGEEILKRVPYVDFVITGEGEISSHKLLQCLEGRLEITQVEGLVYRKGGSIVRNIASFHNDIDDFFYLPSQISPNCHFVKSENYAIVITSRGCPYKCSFCSSPILWKNKIRFHSIANIFRYIKDLYHNFGEIYFSIRDDNFLMNKRRVLEFCNLLTKEGLSLLWNTQGSVTFIDDEISFALAQAGCDQVQLGIESAAERLLSFFNKGLSIERAYRAIATLRKYLIRPFGYFIGGVNETTKEVKRTCDFIKKSGLIDGIVSPLVIYPGTSLAKAIETKAFFSQREIIYFDRASYLRHKKSYLAALEEAFYKNTFTFSEIKTSKTTSFLKDIVTHFYFLNKGNKTKAKAALLDMPKSPWRDKLLHELK